MNVFEELIDELKDENLLEGTVLDPVKAQTVNEQPQTAPSVVEEAAVASVVAEERLDDGPQMFTPVDAELKMGNGEVVEIRKPLSESEYFKKRAMDEVSSLQMIEHVLSGVERDYAKKAPQTYDDFNVKVALNNFLQVSDDVSSDEHKEAEFALMQETEAWCSALAERDGSLRVGYLRRFCENAKPKLSSRAIIATAKFYRNLPYSENVRAKFDFLITRLFSRPSPDHSRTLLFSAAERLAHIQTLYADWASLSLHNSPEDRENAELAKVSFAEFINEARAAEKFDDLIASDFYNRVRLFKESIAEMFFEPGVLSGAIECNVEVGNVYLRLLQRERERFEAEFAAGEAAEDEHPVSSATGRSLDLRDIFADPSEDEEAPIAILEPPPPLPETPPAPELAPGVEPTTKSRSATGLTRHLETVASSFAGVNRWLLVSAAVVIMVSVGMWVWSTFYVQQAANTSSVRVFDIANSAMKGELKVGRVSDDTFYGVALPTWDTMPSEKRKDLLLKIYREGEANGWKRVSLMDSSGKTVAFASAERFEVTE